MFTNLNFNYPVATFDEENQKNNGYFSSYGTPWALQPNIHSDEVSNEDLIKFSCQRYLRCPRSQDILFANGPALPMLPPSSTMLCKWPEVIKLKNFVLNSFRNKLRHHCKINKLDTIKSYSDILSEIKFGKEENVSKLLNQLPNFQRLNNLISEYQNIVNSNHTYIKALNSDFNGGCISYLESDADTGILIYPSIKNNRLKISFHKTISVEERLHLDVASDVELKHSSNSDVHQIVSNKDEADGKCLVGVRQGNKCLLLSQEAGVLSSLKFVQKHRPTYIALSDYIFGESVICTISGNIYLWKEHSAKPIKIYENKKLDKNRTAIFCDFNSGPRLFSAASNRSLFQFDAREADHISTVLFQLDENTSHLDEISVSKNLSNCFYHCVGTQHSFVIVDTRFPCLPVLTWKHSLLSPPQYISLIPASPLSPSDDLVILGSQSPSEVHCFQFHNLIDSSRGVLSACGAPWMVCQPIDAVNLMSSSRDDIYLSQTLLDRLYSPLIGMVGVRHGDRGNISVVQMNSFGDVFSQSFSKQHRLTKSDRTWLSGPGSNQLTISNDDCMIIHDWMDAHTRLDAINFYTNNFNKEPVIFPKLVRLTDKFMKKFRVTRAPSAHCPICSKGLTDVFLNNQDQEEELISVLSNDYCSLCKLTIAEARAFAYTINNSEFAVFPNADVNEIFDAINAQLKQNNRPLQKQRDQDQNSSINIQPNASPHLDRSNYLLHPADASTQLESIEKRFPSSLQINMLTDVQMTDGQSNVNLNENPIRGDNSYLNLNDRPIRGDNSNLNDKPIRDDNLNLKEKRIRDDNSYLNLNDIPIRNNEDEGLNEAGMFLEPALSSFKTPGMDVHCLDSNGITKKLISNTNNSLNVNRVHMNNSDHFDSLDASSNMNVDYLDEELLDLDSQLLLAEWNGEEVSYLLDKRNKDIFSRSSVVYRDIFKKTN